MNFSTSAFALGCSGVTIRKRLAFNHISAIQMVLLSLYYHLDISTEPPSVEVHQAIKKMKSGKAPEEEE